MENWIYALPLFFVFGCASPKTLECEHYDWKCGGECITTQMNECTFEK